LISSQTEYLRAREELAYLTDWLLRLEDEKTPHRKGITTASVRKMISRLQEELGEYEATAIPSPPASEQRTDSSRDGAEGNRQS
jgi:hypothetical protein